MKVIKRKLADLNKCYSVAPLKIDGQDRILVAAEKQDPCLLFDADGSELETVWEGPGASCPWWVPGGNGSFLATHTQVQRLTRLACVEMDYNENKNAADRIPVRSKMQIIENGPCRVAFKVTQRDKYLHKHYCTFGRRKMCRYIPK